VGFLDRLGEVFPGYGALADSLRGGVSEADNERLRGEDRIYELSPGVTTGEVAVEINGRQAGFGITPGWEARSKAELAAMQSSEGPEAGIHAQLFRPDSPPETVHALTVASVAVPEREINSRPVTWALAAEQGSGLSIVSRVNRVRFGGNIGHMWHLKGTMEGMRLLRPDQAAIPIYSIEMWAPLFGPHPRFLKVLLVAPPEEVDNSLPAFNTLIGSWRWTGP